MSKLNGSATDNKTPKADGWRRALGFVVLLGGKHHGCHTSCRDWSQLMRTTSRKGKAERGSGFGTCVRTSYDGLVMHPNGPPDPERCARRISIQLGQGHKAKTRPR